MGKLSSDDHEAEQLLTNFRLSVPSKGLAYRIQMIRPLYCLQVSGLSMDDKYFFKTLIKILIMFSIEQPCLIFVKTLTN